MIRPVVYGWAHPAKANRMKKTLLPIYILLVIGCTPKSTDFEKYISQIKPLTLPVTIIILQDTLPAQPAPDQRLYEFYKYADADGISGKVFENDMGVGILYQVNGDAPTPVLVTYDKQGTRIDSLNLFGNATGFSETAETFVRVRLNPDRTILEIDSTINITTPLAKENSVVDTIVYSVGMDGKITPNRSAIQK